MDNPIYEKDLENVVIKIYQDSDCCNSPDTWGDNEIFLVGWDSRNFFVESDLFNKEMFGATLKMDEYADYTEKAKAFVKDYYVFGIDAYIHGGISLSLHNEGMNCQWDTSNFIGAVCVKKSINANMTRKKAEKYARGLIDTWNDYLNGNVYGYVVEDKQGEHLNSCYGFYGDYEEGALKEAENIAKIHNKEIEETNKKCKRLAIQSIS